MADSWNGGDGKVSMGWKSAVHPLCSASGAVVAVTVGWPTVSEPLRTCHDGHNRLPSVVSVITLTVFPLFYIFSYIWLTLHLLIHVSWLVFLESTLSCCFGLFSVYNMFVRYLPSRVQLSTKVNTVCRKKIRDKLYLPHEGTTNIFQWRINWSFTLVWWMGVWFGCSGSLLGIWVSTLDRGFRYGASVVCFSFKNAVRSG